MQFSSIQNKNPVILICLLLTMAVLITYLPVRNYDFINFDDTEYITENEYVRKGLTRESIAWAFDVNHGPYFHPLTWLSHMMDMELFGMNPGMHHCMNLLFHIFNTLLLFFFLRKTTDAVWKSAIVSALFALHPVNVESVAWIAERKNVLSTFFWMLTILAYVSYVKNQNLLKYLFVILIFQTGLLAKPMLVTLPCVMLLTDYWPLRRFELKEIPTSRFFPVLMEKIPFFILSVFSVWLSSVSIHVSKDLSGGEMGFITFDSTPFSLRISNAAVSYIAYLKKMILPFELSIFYPYPDHISLWKSAGAAFLLILITVMAVRLAKQKAFFITGWLWYMGTLVPVSGLKQAGLWPAMADRWAYIPFIGIFVMLVWGVSDILKGFSLHKMLYICISLFSILYIGLYAARQMDHWRNSRTIFSHALSVNENNILAHNNLGAFYIMQGEPDRAIFHFSRVTDIKPSYKAGKERLEKAHLLRAEMLVSQAQYEEALFHISKAYHSDPDAAGVLHQLGYMLMEQNHLGESVKYLSESVKKNPSYAPAHNDLGIAFVRMNRIRDAVEHFRRAAEIAPDDAEIRRNLEKSLELSYNGQELK
ncbi:MAG: tetratricopeptide repeat protein [Desulfococcaceae bacterium]